MFVQIHLARSVELGCGMTMAQCIATDSTCPIRESNVDKLKAMVNDAARTKS